MTEGRRAQVAVLVALICLVGGAQVIHQPAALIVAILAGIVVWLATAPRQKKE